MTEHTGTAIRRIYRCILENNQWTSDIAVDQTDLAQSENEIDNLIYTSLASQVSTNASADLGTAITVTRYEIRISP